LELFALFIRNLFSLLLFFARFSLNLPLSVELLLRSRIRVECKSNNE
jgi:hypothetical protein